MNIDLRNCDNMELMAQYPDKYFDLVIADPPYGINATKKMGVNKKKRYLPEKWIGGEWDNTPPKKEYFDELFRVSKKQIIWGGNYFANMLPASRCWLVWDKMQRIDQADAELAWTSFKSSVRVFQFHCSKLIGFMNPDRFHPTEKPVALYKWIIKNYAKEGDIIFDPNMGSMSSVIAAYDMGFDFVGCELDKEYFDAGLKRFETHKLQQKIF